MYTRREAALRFAASAAALLTVTDAGSTLLILPLPAAYFSHTDFEGVICMKLLYI